MEKPMHLTHIVPATDESDAGRQAVWTALEIAETAGACVTVLRVVPSDGNGTHPDLEHLQRWVESGLTPRDPVAPITYAVAYGVPGIEIARFAERARASLLVLGRKPRSRIVRLLLGDTADAVARRSGVPCLFVSPEGTRPRHLLVAVDGSERGMTVLDAADRFARQVGADLLVLTVEPTHAGEPIHLALATPVARSARIRSQVHDRLGHEIEVRRGEAAEQILAAVDERRPDVVVLGCHRGGSAGVIEAGSTARQVIHAAPCAVLTVPL
jgi:nucleotide-binding universal stress UspA family protein